MALITAIKATTTTTPTNKLSITADEKQDESKGTYSSELDTTLKMCGRARTGDIMDLPA